MVQREAESWDSSPTGTRVGIFRLPGGRCLWAADRVAPVLQKSRLKSTGNQPPQLLSLSLNSRWCCHLLPLVLFLLYWHVGSWHREEGRWERRDTSAPSRSCYRMERNQPSWQDVRMLCRVPALALLM